jgi:hypothetical protein
MFFLGRSRLNSNLAPEPTISCVCEREREREKLPINVIILHSVLNKKNDPT